MLANLDSIFVFSYPFDPDHANINYQAQLIASNLFCTDSITKNIIITSRFRPSIEKPTDTTYVDFKNVVAYPNPSDGKVTVDIDLTKAAVVKTPLTHHTSPPTTNKKPSPSYQNQSQHYPLRHPNHKLTCTNQKDYDHQI